MNIPSCLGPCCVRKRLCTLGDNTGQHGVIEFCRHVESPTSKDPLQASVMWSSKCGTGLVSGFCCRQPKKSWQMHFAILKCNGKDEFLLIFRAPSWYLIHGERSQNKEVGVLKDEMERWPWCLGKLRGLCRLLLVWKVHLLRYFLIFESTYAGSDELLEVIAS